MKISIRCCYLDLNPETFESSVAALSPLSYGDFLLKFRKFGFIPFRNRSNDVSAIPAYPKANSARKLIKSQLTAACRTARRSGVKIDLHPISSFISSFVASFPPSSAQFLTRPSWNTTELRRRSINIHSRDSPDATAAACVYVRILFRAGRLNTFY